MRPKGIARIRAAIAHRHPQPKKITCLNCGADVDGSYCPACGQSVAVSRYSFKGLTNEVYNHFRKVEAFVVFRTFKALLFTPGKFVRGYLEGKRVEYSSPIKFFFYAFVIQATAALVIHWVTGDDTKLLTQNTDTTSQMIDLVATIFWGVGWWAVCRKSGLNLTENIVAAIYFTSQTFLFTFLLRVLMGPFTTRIPNYSGWLTIADSVVYLAYSFHFVRRLFRESILKTMLKQVVLVVLYLVFMFAVIVAIGAAVGTYSVFTGKPVEEVMPQFQPAN